jgi:hypothetical protein
MQHPAVAEPFECFVNPKGDKGLFFIGATRLVLSLVHPAGHQAPVFAEHNPIFGHRRPIEQVAKTGRSRSVASERSVLCLRINKWR